jgi:hypothetical protein
MQFTIERWSSKSKRRSVLVSIVSYSLCVCECLYLILLLHPFIYAAPQFAVAVNNQPAGNHAANPRPSAAPMAPFKKKGGEDADTTPAVAAVARLNQSNNGSVDNAKVMEAMMNSCKDESEESCVVGSFVGGASLQRSHSEDMSEMTMLDDNASTTSMTTLGGNNNSLAHAKKKESSSSSAGGIPSQLNLQRMDPINTRQANLIDEETIASHITNQLKPSGQLQPIDRGSLSRKSFLPAGWKECFSKTKNRPFWKHPDWGSTWYNPGLSVALTNEQLQSTQQNVELDRAVQPKPKSSGASLDHRTDDESMAKNSTSHLASNEFAMQENIDDGMPQENETDEGSAASSSHSAKKPDPTPLKKPDPTATTATSHASHRSQPTSPNSNKISEDYQKLLAPYQSIEKSVASKALSVASSRHSKASSTATGDISSQCLTQEEFTVTKDEEEVGLGTPSIGNSVGGLDNDDDPAEFDNAHDDEDGYEEDDDLMNDPQAADLNSLSSDHIDVDALLTQRKNESPMSTIRETADESAVDPSPSSALSPVEFGNTDGMSLGSVDVKSSARNSEHDGLGLSSSPETLSKSALKGANAGETLSDDDLDQYDNDDDGGGQSPIFESNVDDVDESDDEVAVSHHQSRQKRDAVDALNLSLDLKKESIGGSSDYSKRKFFPPGPLCSLQFLDEIEEGEFDTPLWRRMKRKRSTLTSVKRGVRLLDDTLRVNCVDGVCLTCSILPYICFRKLHTRHVSLVEHK